MTTWKAIQRLTGLGPAHVVRTDGTVLCGRVSLNPIPNRFTEIVVTVTNPEKKCRHCEIAVRMEKL